MRVKKEILLRKESEMLKEILEGNLLGEFNNPERKKTKKVQAESEEDLKLRI